MKKSAVAFLFLLIFASLFAATPARAEGLFQFLGTVVGAYGCRDVGHHGGRIFAVAGCAIGGNIVGGAVDQGLRQQPQHVTYTYVTPPPPPPRVTIIQPPVQEYYSPPVDPCERYEGNARLENACRAGLRQRQQELEQQAYQCGLSGGC